MGCTTKCCTATCLSAACDVAIATCHPSTWTQVIAHDRAGNAVDGCGERRALGLRRAGRLTMDGDVQRSLIIDATPPEASVANGSVRDLAVLDEDTWRAHLAPERDRLGAPPLQVMWQWAQHA